MAAGMTEGTQLVDAVAVVGVLVGIEDGVQPGDAGIEELARAGPARYRSGSSCRPALPAPTPAGAGSSIVRVAVAPIAGDQRDAARSAAAEDGDLHAEPAGLALANSRKKLAVVAAARSAGAMPRSSARVIGCMGDECRLVALATMRDRRQVRRVGLDQQVFDGIC